MSARFLSLLLLAGLAFGCGKKGPPLAPLYLVPSAVTEISARRVEGSVRLRFVLPSKNQNGPGIDLDRVDVFAVSVLPGAETPPNRELMTKAYLAGSIAVKPAVDERAPAAKPEDARPAPGDVVTFVEHIPPLPDSGASTTRKPGAAKPKAVPDSARAVDQVPAIPPVVAGIKLTQPVRVYVIRGVARNGRSGPPSARVQVPLGAGPEPPGGVAVQNTEKGLVLEWLPAVAAFGAAAPAYNIYRSEVPEEPINPSPLRAVSYEQRGAELGTEMCFGVRSVDVAGPVLVESAMSPAACVTPADVFAPAAPKKLTAVATPGSVQLIWDANTEADLAGYLVLRAEAPDETLQPLTPSPIRDTVYRDEAVKPGVTYVYAVVAVDSAKPPNKSAPSERVTVVTR